MTFRLTPEMREELRQLAERERRSMAWLVEEAVRRLLAEERRRAAAGQPMTGAQAPGQGRSDDA
jgi:predicted transcriptional regulator